MYGAEDILLGQWDKSAVWIALWLSFQNLLT